MIEKEKNSIKAEEKILNTKEIEECLKEVEKKLGKECVVPLSSEEKINTKRCSSGFLSLDEILGGGFPYGRVIEIYGPEGTGKTTLALHAIAEVQKKGGTALFIDSEHSLNPDYVENIGIDKKKLLFSQPNCGEDAFTLISLMQETVDIIVVDSVASLVPKAIIEGDIEDNQIALQARLMSKGMGIIINKNKKLKSIIIFINQLRSKPGITFGTSETTTGGKALKYYSSIRLEIRRTEFIKEGDKNIGSKVKIKSMKNKVASPYQECYMDLIYGKGFDKYNDILEMAIRKNIIKKTASWYEYNGNKIAQGKENTINYLKKNPKEFEKINMEILK